MCVCVRARVGVSGGCWGMQACRRTITHALCRPTSHSPNNGAPSNKMCVSNRRGQWRHVNRKCSAPSPHATTHTQNVCKAPMRVLQSHVQQETSVLRVNGCVCVVRVNVCVRACSCARVYACSCSKMVGVRACKHVAPQPLTGCGAPRHIPPTMVIRQNKMCVGNRRSQ